MEFLQLENNNSSRLVSTSMYHVVFYSDISNCNRRVLASLDIVEPIKLKELGKQIGITCCGDEKQVINELK